MSDQTKWLIAEYCEGPFYMGWHLYLRENNGYQQRNADGGWGWIRWREDRDSQHPAQDVFNSIGITIRGDGTCDNDGYAEFAKRFQFDDQEIGGKPRGGIRVVVNDYGLIGRDKPTW